MSQSPTTATMITPITIHAARFPLLIMVRMAQPPSSQVPADHLLKFSDPLLPVDQGAIVGELKLPQSPVGLDQVQKIGPTCPIARSRRGETILGLWQDGSPIQDAYFPTSPHFRKQVANLKPRQVLLGLEIRTRGGHRRTGLLHTRVVLRLGPEGKRQIDAHDGAEPIPGLKILEPLNRHRDIRVVLAMRKGTGMFVPLERQTGRFHLGPGIGCDLEELVEILGEPLHTRLLRQSQWRPWVLILEGVNFGLRRLATLFENWQLLIERRQFDLCLERIHLT